MNFNLKYIIGVSIIAFFISCDDKINEFEIDVSTESPAIVESSTVKTEALPGQILLSWEVPEGDYSYLQIKYYDPWQKKDIYKIASKETTEVLIENTLARFGEYTFYFQTFNAEHRGGEIIEIKAISGTAETSYTEKSRTKIELSAKQLSTNAQEPTEGPISNLIDGKSNTFFHTRWSSPQIALPHYIQIDFEKEHQNFAIFYQNRTDNTWTSEGRPSVVELQISNDGENWETTKNLTGLPTSHSSTYTSDFIITDKKYKFFRFLVTATSGNTSYFNLAQFAFYDVDIEVYDPESMPID